MLSLYILAAIIALGVMFLMYCFVGFSSAKHHKSERADEHKADFGNRGTYKALLAAFALLPAALSAQTNQFTPSSSSDLQQQIDRLTGLVQQLESRIDQLEGRPGVHTSVASYDGPENAAILQSAANQLKSTEAPPRAEQLVTAEDRSTLDFLRDTTLNVTVDGYYEYNFNQPIGRVNLLRAYDVSSNSFSLNQAGIVIENAAVPSAGKRFGARVDLQYGQATETVQGGTQNELRPQVYRNLWQAYGTYVAPFGSGLPVDFGKWAGALGVEGN